MQYDANNLVVRSGASTDPDVLVEVTPREAGWDYISFQSRRLTAGRSWVFHTGENECALVMLSGRLSVEVDGDRWDEVGGRRSVFEGLPHALYLPRLRKLVVRALEDAEFAFATVPTDEDHPAQLITPQDVDVEIRGGDNATRQINRIIPPGFDCQRLVVVEVYTPSGGWSSYPPHKHDVHRTDDAGNLLEADLEEIYYYKISRPEGHAYQRVYTDEHSPLHRDGRPIDALVIARNDDVVVVPEGYHPVVSPPGYTTYYLNVLAGSAQSLANSDDPRYAWVKESYSTRNPAIPLYSLDGARSVS